MRRWTRCWRSCGTSRLCRACADSPPAPRPSWPACGTARRTAAAETPAKADIRAAFLATGKPYSAAAFEAASRILDRYSRRWTEIYVDACEATHLRGDQSMEVLDLRMAALQEALEDLRALCRELRQATPDTVENAVNATSALGTLERCSDVKLLRAIIRPPDDPATRVAVEQLQARLAELRALQRVGRVADAVKVVAPLEADARRIGYAPLLAETLVRDGLRERRRSRAGGAHHRGGGLGRRAVSPRRGGLAASAINLVYLTGHVSSRFDAGESGAATPRPSCGAWVGTI